MLASGKLVLQKVKWMDLRWWLKEKSNRRTTSKFLSWLSHFQANNGGPSLVPSSVSKLIQLTDIWSAAKKVGDEKSRRRFPFQLYPKKKKKNLFLNPLMTKFWMTKEESRTLLAFGYPDKTVINIANIGRKIDGLVTQATSIK